LQYILQYFFFSTATHVAILLFLSIACSILQYFLVRIFAILNRRQGPQGRRVSISSTGAILGGDAERDAEGVEGKG